MTDEERARLERAKAHPTYIEAMGREPADYMWPALVLGLFYLLVPMLFVGPFVLFAPGEVDVMMLVLMFSGYLIWAVPFLIAAARLYQLRALPVARYLGVVSVHAAAPGRGGRWMRLERLEAEPIDLRLRMRAFLESTGGAASPGKVGVAMCKGDQVVEWIVIPDVDTTAAP